MFVSDLHAFVIERDHLALQLLLRRQQIQRKDLVIALLEQALAEAQSVGAVDPSASDPGTPSTREK